MFRITPAATAAAVERCSALTAHEGPPRVNLTPVPSPLEERGVDVFCPSPQGGEGARRGHKAVSAMTRFRPRRRGEVNRDPRQLTFFGNYASIQTSSMRSSSVGSVSTPWTFCCVQYVRLKLTWNISGDC